MIKKLLWPDENDLTYGKSRARVKDPVRIRFEEFLKQSCFPEIGELYKPVSGSNRNELPSDDDILLLLEAKFAHPSKVGNPAEYSPGTGYSVGWSKMWRPEIEVVLLVFWSMKTQAKTEIAIDAAMFPLAFEKINQPHDV